MQALVSKSHCVFALHYHLVLVTKYRRKCLTDPMLNLITQVVQATLERWSSTLLECNGEADHVPLLFASDPTVTPSKLVNNLKTVTSRSLRDNHDTHLRKYYWKPVLWSPSYALISCGGAPLEIIKQYIQNQDGVR